MEDRDTVELERKTQQLQELYDRSPLHRVLHMQLASIGQGAATVVLDSSEASQNRMGHLHGGAVSTMIDSAIAQAILSLLPEEGSMNTIELKVNYLIPGRGTAFRAEGNVIRLGKSTAVGMATIYDTQDEAVAVGLGTFSVRRARKAS